MRSTAIAIALATGSRDAASTARTCTSGSPSPKTADARCAASETQAPRTSGATRLDRIPARIGLEAQSVVALELRHDAQPLLLAARADGRDRPAAMRREAGAEHHARVAQVRIRHDALAHARDRSVVRRHDHSLGERLQVEGSRAAALLRLSLHPGVEALPGLLAEALRLDVRLQLFRDRR